ncbi:outer membrane lipoprotein-sorting protein [Paucibacter sp. APW11]|uniref:Outer membrane lipoprotein-sorting protein n=1 Tax=Roseateles aquae TaxID=3077235 RepID=A0ABU3P5Q0_9BURK|nr:outer membrane lipoprotein-sorting protein [Paucibacter sp. APW11]MDT8997904.1 outer membrane lipoprotein-sorting protein [Paucibacter sp. APW11]
MKTPYLARRRHFLTTATALAFTLTFAAPTSQAAEPDASSLIQEAWARYRLGGGTEQESIKLRMERPKQAAELKQLSRWTRFQAHGERVLIRFKAPQEDRGLALLISRDSSAEPSQMWLRMPSWPQARRISADRENRYFGGTDLSFEDNRQLLGEAIAGFQYKLLKSSPEAWQIEATPREGTSSAYAKRRITVSAGSLAVTEILYFDAEGSLLKTQRQEEIKLEPSGRWRAGRVIVDNHKEARRSVFEIEQRQFGAALPERLFSPAGMVEP